jgi:cation transport regulator ChaC
MLVFQYGSNCSEGEMNNAERLRGDARFASVAHVDDYELAFDVESKNRGCAASDIVAKPGAHVWGVLYEIPDALIGRGTAKDLDRKSLDQIEGEGANYERRQIRVRRPDGVSVDALTYTVRNPRYDVQTNISYVRHIVLGLREHGIEDAYIARVKAIASANAPALAKEIAAL